MKKIIAAAALSFVAVASASAAGNSWYVGADVGRTTFKADGESDGQTGFGALVGYQLNDNVAFEGALRRLASQDIDVGTVRANAAQVSVLGLLPLANGFSVYARLGLTHNVLEVAVKGATVSFDSNAAVIGIGAQYQLGNNLSIRGEYADLGNNKFEVGGNKLSARISQFNLGLNYAF